MSTLTLVRVQMDQTGSYTATVSNEDDVDEVIFNLEVKGQSVFCVFTCVCIYLHVCVFMGGEKGYEGQDTCIYNLTIH